MKILSLLISAIILAPLNAFSAETHSKLEIITSKNPKEQTIAFDFKVIPNEGLVITESAPWKVTIKGISDLSLTTANDELTLNKFDPKIPGLAFTSGKITHKKTEGVFTYSMRAFVCTKDKSVCYPEQFKGEHKFRFI